MTDIANSPSQDGHDWRKITALWAVPISIRLVLSGERFFHGHNWRSFLTFSDASSFLGVARAILEPERISDLSHYDTRVFPFWPACEAVLLGAGLPEVVIWGLPIALTGLVSWLFFLLTRNFLLAMLLSCAPPVWILSTVHPMSEAVYLAFGLVAALAISRTHYLLAGLLAGAMVATRPFGLAWVGAGAILAVLALWRARDARLLWRFALGSTIGVLPLIVLNLHLYGDVLHQVRVYAGSLDGLNLASRSAEALGHSTGHWGPPFLHVLTTPWKIAVPLWKTVYIYTHVAAVIVLVPVAVWAVCHSWRDSAQAHVHFLLLAFVLNCALIVCTGPYWGFHSFDRYFLWGIPGALLAASHLVPHKAWRWIGPLAAAASILTASFALQRLHP